MPVQYAVRDRIATITLDRPEARNALDPDMLFGLAEAWDAAEADDDVSVVVLTGTGESFCAGGDMRHTVPDASAGPGARPAPERFPNMRRTLLRDRFYPKPIVAAVNGFCVAGGLELLLSTDIRIASSTASFGLQQVHWGLFPLAGATVLLPRQVPWCRAMEMLLVGDRVDADQALAMGLVNEVVAPEALAERARAVATRIAANGPVAVRKVKESAWRASRLPIGEAYLEELRLGAEVFATEDAKEGPAAFLEKRTPRFTGR